MGEGDHLGEGEARASQVEYFKIEEKEKKEEKNTGKVRRKGKREKGKGERRKGEDGKGGKGKEKKEKEKRE